VQTSDIVIIITAVCGLLMVIGGMVLLYKGAVTLKDSNPDEAIKVEFKHMINVTTRYPALGLFVIGLAFTVVALYFVRPFVRPYPPFKISGTLNTDDPGNATVVISFPVHMFQPEPNGEFHGTVDSGLEDIAYEVNLPGENKYKWTKGKTDIQRGTLALGSISLAGPKTQEKPKKGEIAEAPHLPPLDKGR
jgi:hypothetical protein